MSGRTTILKCAALSSGALRGKLKIRLPNGLDVSGVSVFALPDGRRWATWPAEVVVGPGGTPRTDPNTGKKLYRPVMSFSDKKVQRAWSDHMVALVDEQFPHVFAETEAGR